MLGIACPFVDVTDSWRLKERRKRMAVAAAGVYVEWILAAIAGFIWYAAQPGWLPTLAWQVMAVCSLTTLLINVNPLMRYDGYFLLSDLLEVTNLREEAEGILQRFVRIWCLGEASTASDSRFSLYEFGLIVYASGSWLYRNSIVIALVGASFVIATSWNVPQLGWAFAMLAFVSFILIPLGQMMFQSFSMASQVSRGPYRMAAIWIGIVIALVNLAWLPLPHRIACRGTVQSEKRAFVYTQASGRIPIDAPASDPSRDLESSTHLVTLENPWIADQARLASQRQQQLECQVATLRQAAYHQPSVIDQIPTLTTLVSIAENQSLHAKKELDALVVAKPTSGRWIPIELPPLASLDGDGVGASRQTIEDPASRGRWLPAGTAIGYIAPTDRVSIVASIPVSQLQNIQLGMLGRVRFDQRPDRFYSVQVTEISEISAVPVDASPRELTGSTMQGNRTENTSHLSITMAVENVSQPELALGGSAEVVIWSNPMSLYQHTIRFLGSTFGPIEPQIVSRSR